MTDESLKTPQAMCCNHTWKKVNGAEGPAGEMVIMCEKCSSTRNVTPPVKEAARDERPLLME